MNGRGVPERIETVVIGGGQAGLAVGYHLARRNLPFVILEAHRRIGTSWRKRWDSLRLFTPARLDSLPGMPFPAPSHSFPTKDEMADYLEAYAAHFHLPIELGVRVDRVSRDGQHLMVAAGERCFEARNVVVAMGTYQAPRVPAFAAELDPGIVQFHSVEYRNPAQLQDGPVLVVGAGNSGADIALDVAGGHETWLSGRDPGHTPFRTGGILGRLQFRVMWLVGHYVVSVATPLGRKVRPKSLAHSGPLIRVKPQDLAAAGVERLPRTVGVQGGRPVLEDGRVLDVENVIWCTGYRPDFSWIDLPIFDGEEHPKEPQHERGIVAGQPGLYFVGLTFLTSLTSMLIAGADADARYVVKHLAARQA
jgi:putative flavoprotein involved in K+ transport